LHELQGVTERQRYLEKRKSGARGTNITAERRREAAKCVIGYEGKRYC
jgi:hypothetical protein